MTVRLSRPWAISLLLATAWLSPCPAAAQLPLPPGAVFTPVTPCRIVDTRLPSSNPLVAGVPRAFHVVGSLKDFAAQGGTPGGCGIPGYRFATPRVSAVLFNFVAVGPTGAGNLRAWPTDQAVPNASVLNYTTGFNIANGVVVPLSQDGIEGDDLTLRADVSDTLLVVDVVGYFARPYEVSHRRFEAEAGPAQVGRVVELDNGIVEPLCRDHDGCLVTVAMINWDPAQPGNVASRSDRMFVSETSRWWRFTNNDVSGQDANAVVEEWGVFDCIFGDGNFYLGSPNARQDAGNGFGLLNVAGGSYSDTTVTCRVIIED